MIHKRSLTRTSILALLVFGFTAVGSAQFSSPVRDVENPAHARSGWSRWLPSLRPTSLQPTFRLRPRRLRNGW